MTNNNNKTDDNSKISNDNKPSERDIEIEFAERLLESESYQIDSRPNANWRGLKDAVEYLIDVRLSQSNRNDHELK